MVDNLNYFWLIKEVVETILNDEKRKKFITTLIVLIIILILVLALPIYLLQTPTRLLQGVIGNDSLEIIQGFQDDYGYIGDDAIVDVSGDYVDGDIPLFFQFDKRWANFAYAGDTIKWSGCGPTALAMVVVGLTGDTEISPLTMARYSTENGYAINDIGTSWGLMTTGAESFGLEVEEISINASTIADELRNGKIIIASMKKGTFTKTGHFIVLKGITENGEIIVNDPSSEKRSNMTFPIELIVNETKGSWAYDYTEIIEETVEELEQEKGGE